LGQYINTHCCQHSTCPASLGPRAARPRASSPTLRPRTAAVQERPTPPYRGASRHASASAQLPTRPCRPLRGHCAHQRTLPGGRTPTTAAGRTNTVHASGAIPLRPRILLVGRRVYNVDGPPRSDPVLALALSSRSQAAWNLARSGRILVSPVDRPAGALPSSERALACSIQRQLPTQIVIGCVPPVRLPRPRATFFMDCAWLPGQRPGAIDWRCRGLTRGHHRRGVTEGAPASWLPGARGGHEGTLPPWPARSPRHLEGRMHPLMQRVCSSGAGRRARGRVWRAGRNASPRRRCSAGAAP